MAAGADRSELPTAAALDSTAATLARELAWLDAVLQARLSLHFGQPGEVADVRDLPPPALDGDDACAQLLRGPEWGPAERLLLVLALAPHVKPQLLDTLCLRNANLDRGFTEFGGIKGRVHGGFLPTCETAVFLLAGDDLAQRFAAQALFEPTHWLQRRGILSCDPVEPGEPPLAAALRLQPEVLRQITTGAPHKPDFSRDFPAHRMTTPLQWSDLVLGADTTDAIAALTTALQHSATLLNDWRLRPASPPGQRALFFGPPGTGKALTATLLGPLTGTDVYRIDLGQVVSRFVGDTEKQLDRVFDLAEHRRWILFFDEADALLGARPGASGRADCPASRAEQHVMQRIAACPGTVIVATQSTGPFDSAFARRFDAIVPFTWPDAAQRLTLWEGLLRPTGRLAADVDLRALAKAHRLCGGAIARAVRSAALHAVQAGRAQLTQDDLRRGVRDELRRQRLTGERPVQAHPSAKAGATVSKDTSRDTSKDARHSASAE